LGAGDVWDDVAKTIRNGERLAAKKKKNENENVMCSDDTDTSTVVSAEMNLGKSRALLQELKWFTSKLSIPSGLKDWNKLEFSSGSVGPENTTCAPRIPEINWVPIEHRVGKTVKVKYVPMENVVHASTYERQVKHRPGGWKVQLSTESGAGAGTGDTGSMDISCNPISLTARARRLLLKSTIVPEEEDGKWLFDYKLSEVSELNTASEP